MLDKIINFIWIAGVLAILAMVLLTPEKADAYVVDPSVPSQERSMKPCSDDLTKPTPFTNYPGILPQYGAIFEFSKSYPNLQFLNHDKFWFDGKEIHEVIYEVGQDVRVCYFYAVETRR